MDELYRITSLAFGVCVLVNVIKLLTILQKTNFSFLELLRRMKEKEYRSYFFSIFSIISWILLVGYIFVVFDDSITSIYHLAISTLFIAQSLFYLKELFISSFKSPLFRLKSFILFLFTCCTILLLYFFPIIDPYVWLLILDRLMIVILSIGVFALAFPSEIYADYLLQRAMKKVGKRKDIFTIFVLGKDTKKVLTEIVLVLSEKYTVAYSAMTLTNMQIASEVMLRKIKPDTEVFISGIESLSRKDIRLIGSFLSIHSVVITSLSNQDSEVIENILDEVDKNCLIISDVTNNEVIKKYCKSQAVYYTDTLFGDPSDGKRRPVLLYTREKIRTQSFFSFDIFCNESHLMKLKIPQAILVEKKLFLPAIYLGLGLDMSIHMVKQAYKKRNML